MPYRSDNVDKQELDGYVKGHLPGWEVIQYRTPENTSAAVKRGFSVIRAGSNRLLMLKIKSMFEEGKLNVDGEEEGTLL